MDAAVIPTTTTGKGSQRELCATASATILLLGRQTRSHLNCANTRALHCLSLLPKV